MDQRFSIIRHLPALLIAAAASGDAGAHPHENVDQQVLLSLGSGQVTVQVRIVPSYTDGAAIFAHIDMDANGAISETEAIDFGSAVIRDTALTVNGLRVRFDSPAVFVPEVERVSSGVGVIEVDATASVELASGSSHRVHFAISYDDLAHDWFIQPFYFPDLLQLLPTQSIERSASGDTVLISLAP